MFTSLTFTFFGSVNGDFSLSFLASTVFPASNVFVDVSGYVTVTFPFSSTVTFILGFVFKLGFASFTAFSTAVFSSSDRLFTSFTFTFFGSVNDDFSASVFASTVLSAVSSLCELSEYVTVTFPVLSTEIWLSFSVGFTFLTAAFTDAFSSSDNLPTLLTFTFSGSFNDDFSASVFASTVLSAVSSLCELSEYVTVTFPFPSTSIWLSCNVSFAFLTAAFTAVFSVSDNLPTLLTFTFSGSFNGDFSASVFASTVLSAVSLLSVPSGYVTFTFPLSSTSIWLSFNVLFAFLTASFTAVFSASDNLPTLFTFTFFGSVNGDFVASDWTTSILISFEIFSCVTFTGTYFLSPSFTIGL